MIVGVLWRIATATAQESAELSGSGAFLVPVTAGLGSFLRACFEQEVTETTEKAPALCSLRFLLFMIPGFIWLRPKAALVNRDPAGSVSASRSPLGRG